MRSLGRCGKGDAGVAAERNLVLVHTEQLQARSDFETIQKLLDDRAPDIEVFIVNNKIPNSVSRRAAAFRPTLVFSPVPLRAFKPKRGTIYAGRNLRKADELRMMGEAGFAVPKTTFIERNTTLDPDEWGPFVVVKPTRGMQGQGVRLQRTRDVRWVDPKSWPEGDERRGRDRMAQYFVDTGAFTTCYRVWVVLGKCAYSLTSRATSPRPFALDPDGDAPLDVPIAANVADRKVEFNYDPEIIAWGENVQRAFPDVPVLGVDVVREESTGRLFGLEVNAGGLTWSISSNYGLEMQRKHGLDFKAQFNALEIIADALIERTRREAA
jgi:hypothetical protein